MIYLDKHDLPTIHGNIFKILMRDGTNLVHNIRYTPIFPSYKNCKVVPITGLPLTRKLSSNSFVGHLGSTTFHTVLDL